MILKWRGLLKEFVVSTSYNGTMMVTRCLIPYMHDLNYRQAVCSFSSSPHRMPAFLHDFPTIVQRVPYLECFFQPSLFNTYLSGDIFNTYNWWYLRKNKVKARVNLANSCHFFNNKISVTSPLHRRPCSAWGEGLKVGEMMSGGTNPIQDTWLKTTIMMMTNIYWSLITQELSV